jgi:hypothetical protein
MHYHLHTAHLKFFAKRVEFVLSQTYHAPYAGPRRTSPPAAEVEDLRIDVCLLSHTHYDHLDIPSAVRIGNRALWFVPAKNHKYSNLLFLLQLFYRGNILLLSLS